MQPAADFFTTPETDKGNKNLDSKERARHCAHYASEKKGYNIRILGIGPWSDLADYLVFVSGQSDRQVQAIAETIRVGLKRDLGVPPLAVEGMREGRWVLIDYGDVMVHVFQQPVRDFYDLEGMWSEAPELPAEVQPPREGASRRR
ncbi:MAG: ribosome silencing factor [Deltaproteobacteria bacterium]|nr:ribosome silencing factor [Deltaproteobacteria bacterium]